LGGTRPGSLGGEGIGAAGGAGGAGNGRKQVQRGRCGRHENLHGSPQQAKGLSQIAPGRDCRLFAHRGVVQVMGR